MKIVNLLLVVICMCLIRVTCCSDEHRDTSVSSASWGVSRKHEYETEGNITNIIESNNAGANVTVTPAVTCEVARIKCALRRGCGTALQSYMLDCSDVMHGRIEHCDEFCKASLIALTSTEEGENLMHCQCSDEFCSKAKSRLEVCKNEVVMANARNAVVSCSVAHLICSADTSCSMALYYYDKFCRRMFSGRGCSFRCNNSISILERQDKAEKLGTCLCDGTEPFACDKIKTNMATLCFHQKDEKNIQKKEEETNQIDAPHPDNQNSTKKQTSSGFRNICDDQFVWVILCGALWSGTVGGHFYLGGLAPFLFSGFTSSTVVRWIKAAQLHLNV